MGAQSGQEREGLVSINCNSRHAVRVVYPAEQGRLDVSYKGRTIRGEDGFVTLDECADPSIGATALRVHFLDDPAPSLGAFSIVISPRGL